MSFVLILSPCLVAKQFSAKPEDSTYKYKCMKFNTRTIYPPLFLTKFIHSLFPDLGCCRFLI